MYGLLFVISNVFVIISFVVEPRVKSIYEVEKEAKADHRGDCICRVDVIYILHKDTIVGVLDKESA